MLTDRMQWGVGGVECAGGSVWKGEDVRRLLGRQWQQTAWHLLRTHGLAAAAAAARKQGRQSSKGILLDSSSTEAGRRLQHIQPQQLQEQLRATAA